ncbi:MAG: GMC family oxidoreductase [Vicinamibacterales bacterium]
MILDGRTMPSDARLDVDLCIVGAGPAGLSLAREFADSTVRVVILESGGLDREPDIDRLGAGDSVGYPYHALDRVRARGIGGSSLHWDEFQNRDDEGWNARPLEPLDFEPRPGRPLSGWPFRYHDLEPYYRRAQVVSSLGPFAYDAATWEREGVRRLPLGDGVETIMLQRGPLTFAHHVGALAAASNISLIHHATVTRLVTTAGGGRIVEAIARSRSDSTFSVGARRFILATGGIENARILLLTNQARPGGLGNGNGLVGRYFMERLSARGGVLMPTDPGLARQATLYANHVVDRTRVQGVLTLSANTIQQEQLTNAILWLQAAPKAFTSEGVRSALTLTRGFRRHPRIDGVPGHVRNVVADLDQVVSTIWGHLRSMQDRPEVFQVAFQAEATPQADSRVTLSPTRDRYGLPQPRLDWRIAEDDLRSIRRTIDLVDARLRETGVGRIIRKFGDERPPAIIVGNFHHLGTTRMAADPRLGVVDEHCRVHEVENLYVAGSSVFPSGGFANPTLTIVALAIRLADHLKGVLES